MASGLFACCVWRQQQLALWRTGGSPVESAEVADAMAIQLKQDSLEAIRERRMSERAFAVRLIGSVQVLTQRELAHHAL